MGNVFLAASSSKSGSSVYVTFLLIAGLFIVLYFLMIRPQRNRQRQAMQTQRNVLPGQRIRTTAGIYGTVTANLDNDLEVEIAPGVRIRIMRRAVLDVVSDEMSDPAGPQPDGAAPGDQAATTFGEHQDGELSKDRDSQDRT